MAKDKHLTDIATRHQVYLERLKSGIVKDQQSALNRLRKAILEVVTGLETERVSDLTKRQLRQTLTDLRAAQVGIYQEVMDDLSGRLEEVAGYEAAFESRAIEQVAAGVAVSIPAAEVAYRAARTRPLSATGEMLQDFIKGWSAKEVKAVNDLLRKGYTNGWTNQQMAQAIRGTKRNGYKDGMVAKIGRDAASVVRTSVQHTASTARMATWEANSDIVVGYEWVSTLDGKTTQVCRSLDGRVFEMGKGPRPPIHINCRSTTVAELNDGLDFLDKGATRSSKDGYVDADLTYYEWLKRQPKAFQDSAIGPTRGKLLREGGLSADKFARLNLGRNFEPLTLEEMRRKEPEAFERAGVEP